MLVCSASGIHGSTSCLGRRSIMASQDENSKTFGLLVAVPAMSRPVILGHSRSETTLFRQLLIPGTHGPTDVTRVQRTTTDRVSEMLSLARSICWHRYAGLPSYRAKEVGNAHDGLLIRRPKTTQEQDAKKHVSNREAPLWSSFV